MNNHDLHILLLYKECVHWTVLVISFGAVDLSSALLWDMAGSCPDAAGVRRTCPLLSVMREGALEKP